MTTPPEKPETTRPFSSQQLPLPHPPDCPCCRIPEGEGITAFQSKLRRYLTDRDGGDQGPESTGNPEKQDQPSTP